MNQSETATFFNKAGAQLGEKDDSIANGFLHLRPRTHDASLAGGHIPNIAYLAQDLQASVQAVWPARNHFRYSRVEVLLISWKDDDLGVSKEVAELQHVFEDLYHYQVQTYQIPNVKPDKEMKRRMLEFLDNDRDDTLLILYYAGHAKKSSLLNETPIWFANRDMKSPSLPSGGVQSLMEEADADALLLFDCCNAAATTTSKLQQDQRGVTEAIAACGYETFAPEVGEHSFTNALIETLATASKGMPFSVGYLHNRILNRLKCWVPCIERDNKGKMREDVDGRLEYERQPRRTPIYSLLVESKPRRSILLAPLGKPRATRELSQAATLNVTEITKEHIVKLSGTSRRAKKRKGSQSAGSHIQTCSQVILSIQLEGDELDVPAWRECIRLFPAEAKDIKIEGVYSSFSTLLLVRMPVAIWSLLPENQAYSFVGYVTSENRVTVEMAEELGQEISMPSVAFKKLPNSVEEDECQQGTREVFDRDPISQIDFSRVQIAKSLAVQLDLFLAE